MPHKRAKHSVRDQQRNQRGADLAPAKHSLSTEPIPKSLSRVLNASQVREDWKVKKRKIDEEGGDGKRGEKRRKLKDSGEATTKNNEKRKKQTEITIKPGESIQHFNRRVENDMRHLVKSAVQTSLAVIRNVRKTEAELRQKKTKLKPGEQTEKPSHKSPSPEAVDRHADRPKEFKITSSSAPRRLNDVAQAPPEFKKLPRGATHGTSDNPVPGAWKRTDILSMAQKLKMEEERDKYISHYRQLKVSRREGAETNKDTGIV